jgi:chorismate mutase
MLLRSEVENDKSAIEKYICEPLDKIKTKRLTDSESRIIIQLTLSDDEIANKILDDLLKQPGGWGLKAAMKREELVFNNELLSSKVWVFLTLLTEANVGKLIMYLYYLQWKAFKLGMKKVTLNNFCEQIFPWGTFDEKGFEKIWDDAKVEGANLIDFPHCSLSFNQNSNKSK